jgi:UDP-glucose 4-epimerase
MVVPTFVRQALDGSPITVYGDGGQSRCFADVSDVVRGLISLMEHPESAGQIVNIGSTEEVTILELAHRAKDLAGSHSPITLVSYERAYGAGFEDMRRRIPDLTRIQALIGYRPTINLDGILRRLINHERATVRTDSRV